MLSLQKDDPCGPAEPVDGYRNRAVPGSCAASMGYYGTAYRAHIMLQGSFVQGT
jgi:hypothetical protein